MKNNLYKYSMVLGITVLLSMNVVISSVNSLTSNTMNYRYSIDNSSLIGDSGGGWYDGNWNYRKQLNLTNPKNNYPLELNISYDTTLNGGENVSCEENCNSDFSDLRFTESDGTTLRDYVLLNTSDDNYMYMYYGNNGASSSSNPDGVYLFYDDFEDSIINTTKWEYGTNGSGGNVVETNGRLNISTIYGQHGGAWARSNSSYKTFTNNISIEKYAYYYDADFKWFCLGTYDSVICDGTGDVTPPLNWPSFMRLNNSYYWYHKGHFVNQHRIAEVTNSLTNFIHPATWSDFKNQWNNITYNYFYNGTIEWKDEGTDTIGSVSDTSYRDDEKDIFISQGGYDATQGGWIEIEYIRIRRYCPNDEPSWIGFDSEEEFNNPPYEPSDPYPAHGSTSVNINVDLSWIGGDPDGDPVTYDVYLGTSSTPPKVASNQTATSYDPGTLDLEKTHYWKIIAWDNHSAFTEGLVWWFSTGSNQPPSKPIILSAPIFGRPEVQLDFSTVAIDPEGDQTYYMWDWGDGELSGWLGPFVSGQTTEAHHTWDDSGEFEIKVKAKDSNDAESYWSEPVQIIIENIPPDVEITQPLPNVLYLGNNPLFPFFITLIIAPIDIIVNASDDLSGMDRVEFYIKDSLKKTDTSAPYVWLWRDITFGLKAYDIKVITYDNAGNYANDTIMVWKFF